MAKKRYAVLPDGRKIEITDIKDETVKKNLNKNALVYDAPIKQTKTTSKDDIAPVKSNSDKTNKTVTTSKQNDIAPVKKSLLDKMKEGVEKSQQTPYGSLGTPIKTTNKKSSSLLDKAWSGIDGNYQKLYGTKAPRIGNWEDENGLIKKPAVFDDGYQFSDVPKVILGTTADTGIGLIKGAGGLVEGVKDVGAYGLSAAADLVGANKISKKIKEHADQNDMEILFGGAQNKLDQYSLLGNLGDETVSAVGNVLSMVGTGAIGAAAGLGTKGVSTLTKGAMGLSAMGSAMSEAYQSDATDIEAVTYGAISGAGAVATELLWGGMGKTLNVVGFSEGISNADDMLAKKVSSKISNTIAKNFVEYGIKAGAEGTEEVLEGIISAFGKKVTYMSEEDLSDILKNEKLLDQFVAGTVASAVAQSGYVPGMKNGSLREANKTGRDFITGYSVNEQNVINKEIENRIAAEEKDGKQLTKKEKTAIEERVQKDLEKGYISIDTIESALGGNTYKSYDELNKQEKALKEEFDTLNKMKQGEMTGEQIDRRNELKEQISKFDETTNRSKMKEQISKEVKELTANDRYLTESYNEKARRSQQFEADLSKYDTKQQETIKRAAESGILNNTNRTHEFVDMVAKISADKGVLFDFTNNERLKESGFSIEGKTVNGYVKDGNITLNIQSTKALNKVVGHEITHVLEGTEVYTELQQAVKDYATTKGEYDTRLNELKKLYEGVEGANVENELTSDLIGDYLFTDEEFVNRLSSEKPNIFKKIYEEIKYLVKTVTGTKEEKELAKVQRAFEKAYKNASKIDGEVTNYHVSSRFSEEIDKALNNELDASTQVKARDYTPDVLVENGVDNLPMLITQKHIKTTVYTAEEAKKLGLPMGKGVNYHGLGKDLLVDAIDSMDNPSEIYKKDGDNYIIITELKDSNGNDIIVPIKINGTGSYNNVYIDENHIKSVYGKKNLQNYLQKNNFERIYTKKGIALNEGVQYSNISNSSKDSIPESAENSSGNTKYSLTADSDGKSLTKEQQEYFKDSKVRDDNGNLKVMYHGSQESFTVFDKKKARSSGMYGKGFYFTESKSHAQQYGSQYEVYLNITNPIQNGTNNITKEQLRNFVEELAENEDYGIENYGYGATIDSVTDGIYGKDDFAMLMDLNVTCVGNMVEAIELFNEVNGTDYNGIVAPTETVAFYPNQIKNVTNENPTDNPDINMSLSNRNQSIALIGNYNVYGKDIALEKEQSVVQKEGYKDTSASFPIRKDIKAKNKEEIQDIAPVKKNEQGAMQSEYKTEEMTKEERILKRSELHKSIVDRVKETFHSKGFDFDEVLNNAKNLSTFSTVDNTPQRVMEKALGYKEGQVLSDLTVNQVAQNESAGVKWLNSQIETLRQISKEYGIKPGSKESAAAQMYAEGFYVDDKNNLVKYGDAELEADFKNPKVRENIKKLANDSRIRQIYDDTLASINDSRVRNAYPAIPKRQNYFLHFRAMEDTFSRLGLPFNPNDIRAKDLPTDLNGMTADLKPGQPYFASAMQRKGNKTTYDLLGGVERYLNSAKNQIYHIDDIQTLRALRNYIADTFGQAKGLESLDTMTEEEAVARIKEVYNSHLSTFAKFLNEEANVLAGKTTLIDRAMEGAFGRRSITFLNNLNKQVGSNMVGFNVSSSLTNFLSVAQSIAKTNKYDSVKAIAQTASNKIGHIFGKSDGFAENNPGIIRRKGIEKFARTPYETVADLGYTIARAVDDISTEIITRTKFNELTRKGMDEQTAHIEADKWASRLLGDRSLGQQPQLYNSKLFNVFAKFQLEMRNQLDVQFYDTIQEAKVSNEDIENALVRNAKTAAKVTSTLFQLAVIQHVFGKAFESVAGYNPAFDIIEVLMTTLGFDDEEDSEDTPLDNLGQGFLALLEDLPYTSAMTGGRIPISSALPIKQLFTGKDDYGNEKPWYETTTEAAPYYLLPGGYGQLKKTAKGLGMFSDEHPISGSYTDSGNLRFPVEDTTINKVQAALFGQYANKNAREYFDRDIAPLKEKQIQEFKDVDIPISEYWDYREGLKKQEKIDEKFDYVAGLDLPISKKNILINNVVDRKEKVDLTDYDKFENYEEFDFASKNKEKYDFLQENNITYKDYKKSKKAYNWAYANPDKYVLSKSVTDDVEQYRTISKELYEIKADKDEDGKSVSGSRKEKVINYINELDLSTESKMILYKSEYTADDTYNYEIIEYIRNKDIPYEEKKTILTELGFTVESDGRVRW